MASGLCDFTMIHVNSEIPTFNLSITIHIYLSYNSNYILLSFDNLLTIVFQLSFRSVGDTLDKVRMTIREALCIPLSDKSDLAYETEMAMYSFLKNTADTFDLSSNFRVSSRLPAESGMGSR